MPDFSILFPQPDTPLPEPGSELPALFRDLNLDQLVARLNAGREDYRLAEFFEAPLADPAVVHHRHEILRALEDDRLADMLRGFAADMRAVRALQARAHGAHDDHEQQGHILDAACRYCTAVERLDAGLGARSLTAAGLRALQAHLAGYLGSSAYRTLASAARAARAALDAVRFGLLLDGSRVTVLPPGDEAEYSGVIEQTFARFRNDGAMPEPVTRPEPERMNHVESQIVQRVARLHPQAFAALAAFAAAHADCIDPLLARCDRELQFYLAWIDLLAPLRTAGLPFCYPELAGISSELQVGDGFDIVLAAQRVAEGADVVCNDVSLAGAERILVISGPNQGGKTTFARMIGQLHWLARLGLTLPGTRVRLPLCDRIFTHFERQEDIANLRGRLEDDLLRVRDILDRATPASLVVVNEIFSSTTAADAVDLGRRVLAELSRRGPRVVWVTFLDELTAFDDRTVSMVGGVRADDVAVRTFRFERRPADGLAYAAAIARKYGLTRAQLLERIRS
ncbi:DNA mismatch repair protein MutS [Fontimonas sp. SYSU GA230001]|uniref:MutS-related protein n=1 Tax=Fontimonas sp. SYSU GA230001 TaxID=3142450 RepID=UPI0032B564B2